MGYQTLIRADIPPRGSPRSQMRYGVGLVKAFHIRQRPTADVDTLPWVAVMQRKRTLNRNAVKLGVGYLQPFANGSFLVLEICLMALPGSIQPRSAGQCPKPTATTLRTRHSRRRLGCPKRTHGLRVRLSFRRRPQCRNQIFIFSGRHHDASLSNFAKSISCAACFTCCANALSSG
jgi:hypothetical protein